MGNYDFDHIVFYARKRYVEGISTIVLLCNARTEHEKEEIALAALLDVDDDKIRDLQLCCECTGQCKAIDCRHKLKKLIAKEVEKYPNKEIHSGA
jgi:hypothetical protein